MSRRRRVTLPITCTTPKGDKLLAPGEDVVDNLQSLEITEDDVSEEKIAALAAVICRAGDEPATKSAALLVLMAALENATHPKALANTAKHVAFTRCGELNFCGMVNTQIPLLESQLLGA